MPLQPCLRAQSSAAASSRAPAPRLRCPSATTNPFTSARISTSNSGCLLTCTQPITPSSGASATNTACSEAGLIPSSLLRISAAVAGYPSSPASTAIRGASAPFARRIFSSLSSPMGVIFSGRFPLKPCLHGGTLQFAQRVRRNPAGGARSLPADSFRGADGFPVEPFISFPDVSQGPVDRFLHKISLIVRFALDHAQKSHESRIRGRFILVSKIRNQGKASTLYELFAASAPRRCYLYAHAKPAWNKAAAWSRRREEFVKRASFSLIANLTYKDEAAANARFARFLRVIEREAHDERNFVKKAVNWALRNIGKRNVRLNREAIQAAERIRQQGSRSARWIAADALRELKSDAVQKRLRRKTA